MYRYRIDDRTEIRLLAPSDAPALFALTQANREHLRRWLPWLDQVRASTDSLNFIRSSLKQFGDNQGFTTAIVHDGAIVGVIGHHRISWANHSTSIGYWLAAAHEGKGLMTAACRAIIDHSFGPLQLNRVEIRCAEGNTRSRAIPERLGFQREGLVREAEWLYDHFVDHVIYGMLRRDWKPASKR